MVEINLLPPQYRTQAQPGVLRYATWALLPITAAALLIPWVATATKTSDLQRQIDAAQGDIDAATPGKREHDRLVARQRELEQVTTIAQTLRDQKTYWSNDLAAFTAQVPADGSVSLTSLKMTPLSADALRSAQGNGQYVGKDVRRELNLTGQATSQQAVINFLNIFENNPNFGVKFNNMDRNEATDTYTFTANVGVVGAPTASEAAATATGTGTGTGTTTGTGTSVTPSSTGGSAGGGSNGN